MRALVLESPRQPLRWRDVPPPARRAGELLVRVAACAVRRTDPHEVDGELPDPKWPLIPGHEIVGRVVEIGAGVEGFKTGERGASSWLGWTRGGCVCCRSGRENLCEEANQALACLREGRWQGAAVLTTG